MLFAGSQSTPFSQTVTTNYECYKKDCTPSPRPPKTNLELKAVKTDWLSSLRWRQCGFYGACLGTQAIWSLAEPKCYLPEVGSGHPLLRGGLFEVHRDSGRDRVFTFLVDGHSSQGYGCKLHRRLLTPCQIAKKKFGQIQAIVSTWTLIE